MSKWTLIEHLTDYLQRPRLGDAKQPSLWPSEASAVITNSDGESELVGKCRRQSWIRYAKSNFHFSDEYHHLAPLLEEIDSKTLPIDRYTLWIFAAGELYEQYIINQAKASGVFMAEQVPVFLPNIKLSGKVDLIVINPDNAKLSKAEIKSVYGHGGNAVLGTPGQRKQGVLGEPRDSNLMQIALYDWWGGREDDRFEDSRLVYGARDTGRYAEYRIRTEEDKNGVVKIYYRGAAPTITKEVESPITINSIVEDGYKYIENHLQAGELPDRDYDLQYDDEKLLRLHKKGELSKKDSEQVEKIIARQKENETRTAQGLEPKKEYKSIEKGDWRCNLCVYKDFCYKTDGTPRV